jgi:DNA-binding MarR family transcriptional regulator
MDEPRWLTDTETDAWIGVVGLLMFLPAHLEEPLQAHGLSFFEYSIMAALSDAVDRQLPMSTLGELTHGSLSRLSHAIKRLEQRGWVRRAPSAQDGRVTVAELTPEGLATMVAAAPDHVASVRAGVIDALDDEQLASLREICDAVLARIGPPGGIARVRDAGAPPNGS